MRSGVCVACLAVIATWGLLPGCGNDRGLPPGSSGDAAATPDASVTPDAATGERLAWDRDLSLLVTGLGEHEGRTARLRIYYTVDGTRTPWRSVSVARGSVMYYWPGGFDSNTFGELVELYIDRQDDGACSDGTDPAWQLFVNNAFGPGNVNRAEVDVSAAPGGGATPRRCAELP